MVSETHQKGGIQGKTHQIGRRLLPPTCPSRLPKPPAEPRSPASPVLGPQRPAETSQLSPSQSEALSSPQARRWAATWPGGPRDVARHSCWGGTKQNIGFTKHGIMVYLSFYLCFSFLTETMGLKGTPDKGNTRACFSRENQTKPTDTMAERPWKRFLKGKQSSLTRLETGTRWTNIFNFSCG